MKVKSIAPWFGGKRNLAPRIVAELGEHAAYWEPFCGSMAVLLAKPPCAMETVNDLNGELANLARVIQDRKLGPAMYRRLRRTLFCETIHKQSQAALPDATDSIDRAFHYFVKSWMGMSGIAGIARAESKLCIRFTNGGGDPAKRWRSAVNSIPAWRRRMNGVRILNRDAPPILAKIEDADGVVIYCDPPYIEKGAKYVHDFTADDHGHLAESLKRFKHTRVVVSYYDHPTVRQLYDGWTFVDCATTKALVNQGMRDSKGAAKAPELLIINGPSCTEAQLFS